MARLIAVFAACVALAPVPAGAVRLVVRRPPGVRDVCRTAPSWDRITRCVKRFGSFHDKATIDGAHVIEAIDADGEKTGTFLYTRAANGTWGLGGELPFDVEIDDLAPAKLGGQRYRLRYVQVTGSFVGFADNSSVRSQMVMASTMYCNGEANGCRSVMVRCDEYVRGKAMYVFHGVIDTDGKVLRVVGDMTKAASCAPGEQVVRVD